jgi:hypothetical protein
MSRATSSFLEFMEQRKAAASAYVAGDGRPLHAITGTEGAVTFLGPGGGYVSGADDVDKAYREGAGALSDGETRLEILQMGEDDTLAFWTGVQRATVKVAGGAQPVPMDLRITEVFRREHKDWKLVHRHADGMVETKPR